MKVSHANTALIAGLLLLTAAGCSMLSGRPSQPTPDRPTAAAIIISQSMEKRDAPSQKHLGLKTGMLALINEARREKGLPPVELGTNNAAQIHAEQSLKHCFVSHWGVDGLKPYMRYSLASGYQSNAENAAGNLSCIDPEAGYPAINPEAKMQELMDGWLKSPGHRDNILGRSHRLVNIGIAYNNRQMMAYQHFEGDYVRYRNVPAISQGILSLTGSTRNGVTFTPDYQPELFLRYDPPPHNLTLAQLIQSCCYNPGEIVAVIGPPNNSDNDYQVEILQCPNPYAVKPETAPPSSPWEATQNARKACQADRDEKQYAAPTIPAQEWQANGQQFTIKADINEIIRTHGAGVYTVTVRGPVGEWQDTISEYAIFHGVEPPTTYRHEGGQPE